MLVLVIHFHFGISSFSHPDNALEVCGLLTPLHIVPEWYFLCQYAMLKAVPNKNAGFIILLTSIFTFFFFGEIRNLTTFTRLMDYNNGFSISSFFLSLLSFLWIGAQFPQEKFLSYGRILTLDYYFLLMCILFSGTKHLSTISSMFQRIRFLTFNLYYERTDSRKDFLCQLIISFRESVHHGIYWIRNSKISK